MVAVLIDLLLVNDSTGEGDDGEVDATGPWNEGNGWEVVEALAFNGLGKKARAK